MGYSTPNADTHEFLLEFRGPSTYRSIIPHFFESSFDVRWDYKVIFKLIWNLMSRKENMEELDETVNHLATQYLMAFNFTNIYEKQTTLLSVLSQYFTFSKMNIWNYLCFNVRNHSKSLFATHKILIQNHFYGSVVHCMIRSKRSHHWIWLTRNKLGTKLFLFFFKT